MGDIFTESDEILMISYLSDLESFLGTPVIGSRVIPLEIKSYPAVIGKPRRRRTTSWGVAAITAATRDPDRPHITKGSWLVDILPSFRKKYEAKEWADELDALLTLPTSKGGGFSAYSR